MRAIRFAVAAHALLGCASAPATPATMGSGLTDAQQAQARGAAADLTARADAALKLAQGAAPEAAADFHQQGQLLYAAALQEARRLASDGRQARTAEQGRALDAERAELVAQRSALALQLRRQAAAALAQQEAARVFAQAELDEHKRERRRPERLKGRELARRVYLRRARLLLAAARALQAPAAGLALAEGALGKAEQAAKDDPGPADEALLLAQRSLGEARAQRPGPGPAEATALMAAAAERGLQPQRLPGGISVRVPNAFRGNAATPTSPARARLKACQALMLAHPHGPVLLEVDVPPGPEARRRRLLAQRLRGLRKRLAGADGPERLLSAPGLPAEGSGLRLVFAAYSEPADRVTLPPEEPK